MVDQKIFLSRLLVLTHLFCWSNRKILFHIFVQLFYRFSCYSRLPLFLSFYIFFFFFSRTKRKQDAKKDGNGGKKVKKEETEEEKTLRVSFVSQVSL